MEEKRRSFLKKAVVASALSAVATGSLRAATNSSEDSSNGVVIGHSVKKEILYKKTRAWDEYYNSVL